MNMFCILQRANYIHFNIYVRTFHFWNSQSFDKFISVQRQRNTLLKFQSVILLSNET